MTRLGSLGENRNIVNILGKYFDKETPMHGVEGRIPLGNGKKLAAFGTHEDLW